MSLYLTVTNVHYVDFTDQFYGDKNCSLVIGNVLIYTDDNHITATYSKTLAPFVQDELMPVLKRYK